MDRLFVKPATPELKVRKPANGYLAAEGEAVNAEGYWLRRLADGDVVEVEPPAAPVVAVVPEVSKVTSRKPDPAV